MSTKMHESGTFYLVSGMAEIAPLVRHHRKRANLSQEELANLASVARRTISNIEKGEKTVELDSLLKVLNVLNMPLYIKGPFVGDLLK